MAQTAPTGPSEQELRELAMRGESVRAQLSAVENQREYVMELAAEARRALASLEHLVDAREGDEILLPLGGGAFVHGHLARPGVALATLGSGVHAEMPMAEARDRMRTRVEALDNAAQTLTRDATRLTDEMTRISMMLESFYGA